MNFSEHFSNCNLDVRLSGDARFMDQKVTPDVLYVNAICILEYVENDLDIEFTTKDIWESPFASKEVKTIFHKPDVLNARASNEYDKFFAQPLKMLAYAKVLTLVKKGNRNYFKVNRLDLLEFITIRERNSLTFIIEYLKKVLGDSGLWPLFEKFFKSNSNHDFVELKDGFKEFIYDYTRINRSNIHEPSRIFTKIINPLAYHSDSLGTKGGFLSKDIIGREELMYNRRNWRDIIKRKAETREEFELRKKGEQNKIENVKAAFNVISMQQAKKMVVKRNNGVSEVDDDLSVGLANQVHHIFPVNEHPELDSFVENLILLTATQHLTKAHPRGKTKIVDKAYQYICLMSKCNSVQVSCEELNDRFYSKHDLIFVLNEGISVDDFKEEDSFVEITGKLTEIYHYT